MSLQLVIVGLTIFPMKRVLFVSLSKISMRKGRLNSMAGGRDTVIISAAVAAAASAPLSSTSRAALWTT